MKTKCMAFIVTLWSCSVVYGKGNTDFTRISSDYRVQGSSVEVPNMPRIRSQDSVGICFGMCAATVAQHYYCKIQNITNCSEVSPEKEISALSMVAWANTNDEENGGVPEARNHTNIRYRGAAANALENSQSSVYNAESCYPFDQFANKYGDDKLAVDEMLKRAEIFYNKYKNTEGTYCESCALEQLNKDLVTSASAEDLKLALKKETFGEFLYKLHFRRCGDLIKIRPVPKFGAYPDKSNVGKGKKEVFVSKIKEQLSNGRPVALDGICIDRQGSKCKTGHSVVISGYRKMCKSPTQCRDVFKVQNSWGEDWQRRYDGGWVDGNDLLANAVKEGAISWYE